MYGWGGGSRSRQHLINVSTMSTPSFYPTANLEQRNLAVNRFFSFFNRLAGLRKKISNETKIFQTTTAAAAAAAELGAQSAG